MKHLVVLFAGLAISTTALQAQNSPSGVPESHRPPAGMCRIWIDGVPPTHQPAPTDCATAIRKRPMNARVVFGNDAPNSNAPATAPGSARNFAPAPPQSNFAQPSTPVRDDNERQRVETQRIRDEQEKRASHHDAPPAPSAQPVQHQSPERVAPSPRPRSEKAPRPPRHSFSPGRQR
ncbi:MAG: hypothetical protein M3Y05_07940 [Gemmatimonadota bacterium]|nr:hypothetical protein [Gemmatimonadota bacterium]